MLREWFEEKLANWDRLTPQDLVLVASRIQRVYAHNRMGTPAAIAKLVQVQEASGRIDDMLRLSLERSLERLVNDKDWVDPPPLEAAEPMSSASVYQGWKERLNRVASKRDLDDLIREMQATGNGRDRPPVGFAYTDPTAMVSVLQTHIDERLAEHAQIEKAIKAVDTVSRKRLPEEILAKTKGFLGGRTRRQKRRRRSYRRRR